MAAILTSFSRRSLSGTSRRMKPFMNWSISSSARTQTVCVVPTMDGSALTIASSS